MAMSNETTWETGHATVHEPTAKHLRERVEGPVVVWDLTTIEGPPQALAVADVLNTWLRHDAFTVILATADGSSAAGEAWREFAAGLNLVQAWIIAEPEPGQRQALAERAAVWLTEVPAAPLVAVAEALAALLDQRLAPALAPPPAPPGPAPTDMVWPAQHVAGGPPT
ncbi:MAG: hypothetical protein JWL70_2059 [Acidimicrobiia bacterium]|nr:hypothetical protein [Acidimicrobiia bacterium]